MNEIKYLVTYQIATYSGTIEVWADSNAETEEVIGMAKVQLRRSSGPLPFGYESWNVERSPEFAY